MPFVSDLQVVCMDCAVEGNALPVVLLPLGCFFMPGW